VSINKLEVIDFKMTSKQKMEYKIIKPDKDLMPFIHFYWELKGHELEKHWERVFPDGCAGILTNLGDICLTDNGSLSMAFGKTYVVGAMTSFKDSLIDNNTHLLGVCLKPATFINFYNYAPQNELTNATVEFEKSDSFNVEKMLNSPLDYLNQFFSDRIKIINNPLQSVINDIHLANGQISIYELSKRNSTTVKQLERNFKKLVGLSPKAYSNIIRFQKALRIIQSSDKDRPLSDIAFACGYYDHSHLTNEVKRYTGRSPSQL